MSCGRLHEPGEPFHLHAPGAGHEHDHDHEHEGHAEDSAGDGGDAPETRGPGPVRRALSAGAGHVRSAAAGAWQANGYLVKPFAMVPAADGTGWFIHQVFGSDPMNALIAAAAAGLAGGVTAEIKGRRRGEVRPVLAKTRQAAAAATILMALTGAVTPVGPADLAQAAVGVVGVTMAGRVSYEKKKAHARRPRVTPELTAAQPEPEPEAPAGPDPREVQFSSEFLGEGGPLAGAAVSGFRELPNGFLLELSLLRTPYSLDDVQKLETAIAKLYHVRRDGVNVDYVPEPGKDNENFCQVTVRKLPAATATGRARPAVNRWNGASTWNPETGTFDIGHFTDQETAHYHEHRPRSGAMMGLVAGVPDSGKTGTLHNLAAEAGQASLCRRCGRAGTAYSPGLCVGGCDLRRVMAVWTGDAQAQAMSIWRGRADATGWGPEGCVELLEFADAVYEARGQALDALEWWDQGPDGRRRHNTGKSWWDVEIGWPLIDFTLDEWPLLVLSADPDLSAAAKHIILKAVTLWRKRGIHLKLAAQTLDMTLIGVREAREIMAFFNIIGHRLDQGSSALAGLAGDPRRLLANMPGAGYIGHFDRRPGTEFSTKYCPVQNKPGETGVDIRHLAGVIGQTPIELDPGYLAALAAWGIEDPRERLVFTEWRKDWASPAAGGDGASAAPYTGPAAVQAPAAPGPAVQAAGTAYREDCEKVRAWLLDNPGPHKLAEIMRATDLNMGPAKAACAALVSNGQAAPAGDREFQAA